ncbi:MAG: carboxypeptidase regulatory-like domain-containing protein [Acidobacteria bacterium]|nr:carboxypeptidase regulatory-like domain-containing protein [Acidobacteriota bacterium]
MRKTVAVLALVVFVLFTNSVLLAQLGTQGSILGVVTDSTGAVVPGASAVITNVDTGQRIETQSNEAGIFQVFALNRGFYSVQVLLDGFKTWNLERTELTVGQRLRLSPALEVGDVAEQITVESSGVELIQTEGATVQGTVEARQIVDLPINGRNPAALVNLVPGMRFVRKMTSAERGNEVSGAGVPVENTEFQIDGLNANAGMNERGITIPNVDTIAEFRVETSSFSAENGRQPIQMIMATKAGTNEFHGALWEFLRNDNLDARNAFSPGTTIPKLTRNQYGGTVGGPIVRNRTFFFFSPEATRIRQERIYNSPTISPEMLQGDFSSVSSITNPFTGDPYPNNQIPLSEVSGGSSFFFDQFLLPNSPGNRFRAVAPRPDDSWEFVSRIDHQLADNHRLYGRWIITDNTFINPDVRPDIQKSDKTRQNNFGLNYAWTLNPTSLLNMNWGYTRSLNDFDSSVVGANIGNLTEQAGIRGFQTAGREAHVGLPTVGVAGYTAYQSPWGGSGRLWFEAYNAKVNLNLVRGRHTLTLGGEYNTRSTYGNHGSCCARGNFTFNGQYTGDGFADYFLGLVQTARRNFPLQTFGMSDSPYTGFYFNDSWKVSNKVTVNFGVRHDFWHEKAAIRGNHATFDPRIGKAVAGETPDGRIDLTSQPVAMALAEFTKDVWVSATEAGIPHGLFEANGVFSPRLGVAWRPFSGNNVVVRGGYGIFPMQFVGNRTASAVVGPPYWNFESASFARAENQRWETAFPEDPNSFLSPSVAAPAWDIVAQKTHEWNVSIQMAMPAQSALTLSYVGNYTADAHTGGTKQFNVPVPGKHPNLAAARPFPIFGNVGLVTNVGHTWYNSAHLKWERRFTDGWLFTTAYAWGKYLDQLDFEPHAPDSYNRGRNAQDRTHILAFNTVYELPLGRGRALMADAHPAVNAILGDWQIAGIYRFASGAPLSINVPGATLGNGRGTRADITGDPQSSSPSASQWFNPGAFIRPAAFTFGNSARGILDGPGSHILDFGLMKNFYVTEGKYLQFRWEMFNALNQVNLNNPNTNLSQNSTAQILSSGDARQMQFGLKFIY